MFLGGLIFWDFLLLGVFGLLILNCFYSFFGNSLDFLCWNVYNIAVNDEHCWRWCCVKPQFYTRYLTEHAKV